MGICASGEKLSAEEKASRAAEAKRNRELEAQAEADDMVRACLPSPRVHRRFSSSFAHSITPSTTSQEDKQINKLLLLGAGESGKSTLFKQM